MFKTKDIHKDDPNIWGIATIVCSPVDTDPFVTVVAKELRDMYGELELLQLASADSGVGAMFDLKAISAAFLSSLPNSAEEKGKPSHLANYRSEPAEAIARRAVSSLCDVDCGAALNATKGNANQPMLGFDSWGLASLAGSDALVLIQVKGTDDSNSPPQIAQELINECKTIRHNKSKLTRHLCAVALRAGDKHKPILLKMLERIGSHKKVSLIAAPVLVRGIVTSAHTDLDSIKSECSNFKVQATFALSVSIGADLAVFGQAVLSAAKKP